MPPHWWRVYLSVLAQLQRDSYKNGNDNGDIVSCECIKELFLNSSDPDLIKMVEEKYEYMDGIEQGGLPTSRLILMICLISVKL